jgi:phosphatidylserine decarboxylase
LNFLIASIHMNLNQFTQALTHLRVTFEFSRKRLIQIRPDLSALDLMDPRLVEPSALDSNQAKIVKGIMCEVKEKMEECLM